MGEEEKAEEKKAEEVKKPEGEEKKSEEKKEEEAKKPEESSKEEKESKEPPPPPEEIVLKVFMHCEGCARKVKRCLKGFEGVEDVQTDCKAHKVIVKGKKADPLKVLERVQKKSHKQVELLTPIPKPPAEEPKKPEEEKPKPEEKKQEPPVIIAVLRVYMHCEACAQQIRKRMMRMKGVESADPDLKSSQVIVKGVFDPAKLVEYVYKRTGKHAVIVKTEAEIKKEEEQKAESNKENEEKKKSSESEEKERGEAENQEKKKGEEEAEALTEAKENSKVEVMKNEFYYYPPKYPQGYAYAYPYPYAPQIFSDENPNACSVM